MHMQLRDLARLESQRQAISVAELADIAMPIMGGVACYTAPGSWTNQAIALALDAPATIDEIDRLTDFYTSRAQEPRIEVCPFTDDSLIEFEAIMARTLGPDERFDVALPPAISIRRIEPDNADDIDRWIRASNACFITPDAPHEPIFTETSRRMLVHQRTVAFAAELAEEIIATAAVEVAQPMGPGTPIIACLIAGSVLPEHRRRGIQTALIAARLRHALDAGARLAIVHSRPSVFTYRSAERWGFVHAYSNAVLIMRSARLARSI